MRKVLVELFTLDSGGCAPCTYLKEMADAAGAKVAGRVEIVEHKIKDKAAVRLMKERGVKFIPTVCMDGEIVYESLLPAEDEFIGEIVRRLD